MKAAYITERPSIGELGSVIHLDTNLAVPNNIKPHEILVEVKAFSINVDDIHVAEGSFLGGVPGLQRKKGKGPLVIGCDFAGLITRVGNKVTKFKVGQRVCGINKVQGIFSERGSWAEYTVTQSNNIIAFPEHISYQEAAALVMPLFVTHGLLLEGKLNNFKGNKRVLVIGASGGIGSVLIPILQKMYPDNLHITGVCSGRNEKFVLGLGANQVLDYTKGPIKDSLQNDDGMYDVVFDLVGGQSSYETAKAILGKKGRFITATGPMEWVGDNMLTGCEQAALIGKLMWYAVVLNCIPGPHPYYQLASGPLNLEDAAVFNLAFENHVKPQIEKSISFEDPGCLKEAIDLVRSHRVKGKVVVEMN